jgi:hypothetical protein
VGLGTLLRTLVNLSLLSDIMGQPDAAVKKTVLETSLHGEDFEFPSLKPIPFSGAMIA